MLSIYLSHETALAFWRCWSIRNALSLGAFHYRKVHSTEGLPFRALPSSSVLAAPIETREDLVAILEKAARAEDSEALRCAREAVGWFGAPESDEEGERVVKEIHVLGPRKPGAHGRKGVVYHHSAATFPKRSFLKVAEHVYVCAPELVFVQMASSLSRGELLALGYELCGSYSVDRNQFQVRHPLSTSNRLRAYAEQIKGAHGAKLARSVARCVHGKSASPAETRMAAIVATPRVYGGLGLGDVRLNEPIRLSGEAERIAHAPVLVCDAVWAQGKVVLEYDSVANHLGRAQLSKDSRRRSALAAEGFTVRSVTGSQLSNVYEFQETVVHAFREHGRYLSRLRGKEIERHMKLRGELFKK